MRLPYLTTSQIPELRGFELPERRRFLSGAMTSMKVDHPTFPLLPTLLGLFVGFLCGFASTELGPLLVASYVEASTWDITSLAMIFFPAGSSLGFLAGWFFGQAIAFARARPYLRELVEKAIDSYTRTKQASVGPLLTPNSRDVSR